MRQVQAYISQLHIKVCYYVKNPLIIISLVTRCIRVHVCRRIYVQLTLMISMEKKIAYSSRLCQTLGQFILQARIGFVERTKTKIYSHVEKRKT
jgi:hypothetical protein